MATLTRKVALEVLGAIRELEERARIPLSVSVVLFLGEEEDQPARISCCFPALITHSLWLLSL